jgi:hypothetical protein
MTPFIIIGCVAILAFSILTGVTIFVQAWERVQIKRTDNFVTVNRDGFAAQRNIIRDQTRNQDAQ